MVPTIPDDLRPVAADLLLAVADDKLLLGHRNSDWTGLAPILEEDIAFSSIAQDEIAHAQALYALAAPLMGISAEKLAFGRRPPAWRCAEIVEPPDGFDWAVALTRQFFCDHFDRIRLGRLARSSHPPLAALAARLAAEEEAHVAHVDTWMGHLGRGTEESRARVQAALERTAPLAPMLFEPVAGEERLVKSGFYPPHAGAAAFEAWARAVTAVAEEAGLHLALAPPPASRRGGRHGRHSTALGELLAEMSEVFRLEPDAAW